MTVQPSTQSYIGAPLRRREDIRFVTGQGQYLDDVRLPNMLHAAILRSPHAHARVRGIDATVALALDGVTAVFTHADMARADETHSQCACSRCRGWTITCKRRCPPTPCATPGRRWPW